MVVDSPKSELEMRAGESSRVVERAHRALAIPVSGLPNYWCFRGIPQILHLRCARSGVLGQTGHESSEWDFVLQFGSGRPSLQPCNKEHGRLEEEQLGWCQVLPSYPRCGCAAAYKVPPQSVWKSCFKLGVQAWKKSVLTAPCCAFLTAVARVANPIVCSGVVPVRWRGRVALDRGLN